MKSLNDVGKPVWIILAILGFLFWWPVGLAIIVYMIWSGKFGNGYKFWTGNFWSSGNSAFDAHRDQVLKDLEDEKSAFAKFIKDKLSAKDQAEFAEFSTKRKKK